MADTEKLPVQTSTLAQGVDVQTGKSWEFDLLGAKPGDDPVGQIYVKVRDYDGAQAVPDEPYAITGPHGVSLSGKTDKDGIVREGNPPIPVDVYTLKVSGLEFTVMARPASADPTVVRLPAKGQPAHTQDPYGPPPRPPGALGGRAWLASIQSQVDVVGVGQMASLMKRDELIYQELAKGNVPDFNRLWVSLKLNYQGHTGDLKVLADCLAIGSNDDYIRVNISGYTSQRIADAYKCLLPTQKLIFDAYAQAPVKLVYHALDCIGTGGGLHQISNLAMRWHDEIVQGKYVCGDSSTAPMAECAGKFNPQLQSIWKGIHKGHCTIGNPHPMVLCVGHKKEVAISHEQCSDAARGSFRGGHTLTFFGFFCADGTPQQGYFQCAHYAGFTDAAQGTRLVHPIMLVDGKEMKYEDVLQNKDLCGLVITTTPGKYAQPNWYPYTVVRYPSPPPGKMWMG
jgi:hypothetical protein